MIDQYEIDTIKQGVDLIALMRDRGVELKQVGTNYQGFCPFHEDTTPSLTVNPKENLWNCFGCNQGGDNIRFVQLFDHIGFDKAFELLKKHSSDGRLPAKAAPKNQPQLPEAKASQLLERTLGVFEQGRGETAVSYLAQRGITDPAFPNRYHIGYSDGNLPEILPSEGGVRQELITLGILNDKGYERFRHCLVFPVYDLEGNIVTLYGRSIKQGDKRHLFLPNRPTGLWNIRVVKSGPEVILVESIIDGLSVAMAGFANVVACNGTNGLSDNDIKQLKEHGVAKITLLFDGDEAGRNAAKRLKKKMSASFQVQVKTLPESHDPNSYLLEYGPEKLAKFITEPQPAAPSFPLTADADRTTTPDGFIISRGLRRYQIIGLDKGRRKLKATVRLEHGGKVHVDTLDFYSARARRTLAKDICRIFNEVPETIEGDIAGLMTACEQAPQASELAGADQPESVAISAADRKEAEELGKSPELISTILADFETRGLIGEEANKLLGYVAMTSRKLDKPLSMLILSSSGAGKTALQDGIAALCPAEDLVKITSLTGKALFYKEQQSLKHKVLAIEEGNGADDAAYAIRSLISNGVLISESTIKDLGTGRLTTMENRVEGPTAVFLTTTNPDTDPETASRFFVTGIDESREQTRKILAFQRKQQLADSRNSLAEKIRHRHHNFQRLLQPIGIRNPYAQELAYEDDRLQGRRDQPKYLQLIKAVAFLRQMQKEIKGEAESRYVEVDLEDIRIANDLTNQILGRSLDELSRPGRDLLMLLDQMVAEMANLSDREAGQAPSRTTISFTRRDIREFSGWANARVHRYLKELVELEYVLVNSGRNGSTYRYRLAYEGQGKEGEKFVLGLRDVGELAQ